MTTPAPARTLLAPSRRAFSLVEAAISVVIVAVMIVAAMSTMGAARLRQYKTGERIRARLLADDLMAEILTKFYADPAIGAVFGPEPAELLAGRPSFDDVDDYNGWSESPPKAADGTVLAGFTGWSRSVSVAWTLPSDLTATSLIESGVKRITVTVSHNNVPISTVTAIRTDSW